MLSGTYERITARTVSVDMHFNIPWSSATDMPKVDLPVPGPPLMSMSLGGSFSRWGGAALKCNRCFIDAAMAVVVGAASSRRRLPLTDDPDRRCKGGGDDDRVDDGEPNAWAVGGDEAKHDATARRRNLNVPRDMLHLPRRR